MISSNFYLNFSKKVLINSKVFSWWLLNLLGWLWCCFNSWSLFSCFFNLFSFLFLLFTISTFKTKFFQGFFKFSQIVFLFILLLFLFWLLLDNWLCCFSLSFFNWFWLLLLFAIFFTKIEWVSDGINLEFFLLKFFRLESSLDGFHVTETSSEMFLWIKWLDSWFLLLLFVLSLVFSLGFFLSWLLSLLFVLVIRLLFFRFWIFFIAGNISPKSL